ncbi:BatD family protein [Pedobacter caeni]|uniref:Oxygen tolerance n=1 Tax=Pedobacter caeni TaxID=288992 RepID=A0A1M4VHY9_9SPHI|nr:BatD family protein [Pedobacter caeni]SHE68664.1 Oxygen tolerance [Pedobacter caeni]
MTTLFWTSFSSCQEKKEPDFIQYVVQPEVEIGKNTDFYVRFAMKPDHVSSATDQIKGLTLTDGLSRISDKINESESTDENGKVTSYFHFYTYARPEKLGKIDFPVLTMKVKGKEYKTRPFSINVVQQLKVGADAVKVALTSDKAVYSLKDTIAISLYEYSRFINVKRKKNMAIKGSVTGKDNEITISSEPTLDDIAGIKGFEDYLKQNFELVNFDWDAMGDRKSIEIINGISYVKTKIFTTGLVPKNKGEFKIEPSEFEYHVYKSNTDYFSKFEPQDSGGYKVTDKGATQLQIKSQALEFKVK